MSNIQSHVLGWGPMVTKIECANHAIKCYRNRLEAILQDYPKYKGKGGLTQNAIKRLTAGARCAIKMHTNIDMLRKDLRNGPNHVFDDHTNCSQTFCKVAAKQNIQPTPPCVSATIPNSNDSIATSLCKLWKNNQKYTMKKMKQEGLLATINGAISKMICSSKYNVQEIGS